MLMYALPGLDSNLLSLEQFQQQPNKCARLHQYVPMCD